MVKINDEESYPLVGGKSTSFRNSSKYNIIVLGLSFCILFSAFSPTQELETTINQDLGSYSLAVLYGFLSFSNFISPFVIQKLGEKWSLIVGTLTYALYIAANIRITQVTLFLASAILGIGGAILWTAQGSFVIQCSTESTIGTNTGLFFALFQVNQIIGNLGAQALIIYFQKTIPNTTTSDMYLFSIFLGVALLSIIGFLFLGKPVKTNDKGELIEKENETLSVKDRLMSTLLMFKDRPIQLLIPALLYSGISQSFFFGVFSAILGKEWIGYVMSVFGFCDAIASVVIGKLSDKIGRKILVFVSTLACIGGTVLTYLLSLYIEEDKRAPYYFICAALMGIADAGYNTQLYSLIGVIYPKKGEVAAGVFKFVQSIASAIAFVYGPYVVLFDHICILNSLVVLSCALFMFADNFAKRPKIDELF